MSKRHQQIVRAFLASRTIDIESRNYVGTATVTYYDPGEDYPVHSATQEPPDAMELHFEFHDHDGKYIGDEITVPQEVYNAVLAKVVEIANEV